MNAEIIFARHDRTYPDSSDGFAVKPRATYIGVTTYLKSRYKENGATAVRLAVAGAATRTKG
jgi:hypothetical protein